MRKTLAGLIGIAATAAIITGAAMTAANASPAAPTASGTEHFDLMTTMPSTSRYSVIATGVFTAGGTDISGSTTDKLELPGGTFKVHHGGRIHVITEKVNQKTCLADFVAKADLTVGDGTGRYKGISGTGHAVVSELFIARRSKGACDPNLTPVVLQETIKAQAHVKV